MCKAAENVLARGLKLVPGATSSSHPSVGGGLLQLGLRLPAPVQRWAVGSSAHFHVLSGCIVMSCYGNGNP